MPNGLNAREMIERRSRLGNGGLHADVNNFRSLMPFMIFEDGKLVNLKLYPIRLDMESALPDLADKEETKKIYDYLLERNKQFNTKMQLSDGFIEVLL